MLEKKIFLLYPSGELKPTFVRITIPEPMAGKPGVYESFLEFEHVIDGRFRVGHQSTLDVIMSALDSARGFAKTFEKEGGKFFVPMFDDADVPWREQPMKAKDIL